MESQHTAEFLVVGIAPGRVEESKQKPLVGPAGVILRKALSQSALGKHKIVFANLIERRMYDPKTGKDRPPTLAEIQVGVCYIGSLVKTVNPKAIISLGALVTRTLTKSLADAIPVEPVIHPSVILRAGHSWESYVQRFNEIGEIHGN